MKTFIFGKNKKIMKKILLLFTIIAFASCSSDDDSGDANTTDFEQIETILPQGDWEVSKFMDDETDSTNDFESFVFTFDEDGTVVAQNDLFTENGTWAYDNSSSTEEELVLQFSQTTPFNRINDDWEILSVSNSKVELSNINSEDNLQLLTFTKL